MSEDYHVLKRQREAIEERQRVKSAVDLVVGGYSEHPKVIEARRLLCEAVREIKQEREQLIAAQLCECGHRRDSHGPSYSVNYTEGVCFKGAGGTCKCLHFLGAK